MATPSSLACIMALKKGRAVIVINFMLLSLNLIDTNYKIVG